MKKANDQYAILGLTPDATQSQVREAYRLLCLAWHPDRFPVGQSRDYANEKMIAINSAYEVLYDSKPRKEYDQEGEDPIISVSVERYYHSANQQQSEDRVRSLVTAASQGDVKQVKLLISFGVKCDSHYMGFTALMAAAAAGHLNCLKVLIARGADVNIKDEDGLGALAMAIYKQRLDCVEYLVSEGADVWAKAKDGVTPLKAAIRLDGSVDFLNALLSKHVALETKDANDVTLLMFAAASAKVDCVSLLISKGADVNAKTSSGITSLMLAACVGAESCVAALISSGANVNAEDHNGITALMVATDTKHQNVVTALLKAGAKK